MAEEGRVVKHFEKAQQALFSAAAKDVEKGTSLTEQYIFRLQDFFLNPGFHIIKVNSKEEGRYILIQFLHSLRCYSSIGILTSQEWSMPNHYQNVLKEMDASAAFLCKEHMEDYLLQAFNLDFLAIEGTDELIRAAWFGRFEHLLIEYGITTTVPVILFMYT